MREDLSPVLLELRGGWRPCRYTFGAVGASLNRVIAYVGGRSLVLFITVAVGVYLVILVANMGGAMDKIREAQIREEARLALQSPQFQLLTEGDRQRIFEQFVETRRREEGLHRPFFLRSFSYLVRGITLDFGRSERISSDSGSNQVRLILLERLPHTLLLWGTSQLLLFFGAVFVALRLSRRPSSALDRVFLALVPTSATPAWLYGILLLLLFASRLQVLPYGGFVDAPPPSALLPYVTSVLRHLALPVLALFLAGFFEMTYVWRGLFLLQAGEDYVETGEAKGLPRRILVRRYILRPSFSPILTAFTLRMIRAWMGGILTETVFAWPGLGRLLWQALNENDTPVIVGATVIYGYLLAGSVLMLDLINAFVDPRLRMRWR